MVDRKLAAFKAAKRRMPKIKHERLLDLAKALASGKIAHETFDFTVVNFHNGMLADENGRCVTAFDRITKNPCGSSGCAIGQCAALFPKHFTYVDKPEDRNYGFELDVVLKERKAEFANYDHYDIPQVGPRFYGLRRSSFASAAEFCGLLDKEVDFLFAPTDRWASNAVCSGVESSCLGESATASDVARHIRNFVKKSRLKRYADFRVEYWNEILADWERDYGSLENLYAKQKDKK